MKQITIFQRLRQWIRGFNKLQFIAMIAIIVLLCVGSAGALYWRRLSDMEKVFQNIDWTEGENDTDSPDMNAAFSGQKIINIALLGHDNNEARSEKRVKGYTGLVDTIMIAAINIDTAEVNLVSIPRDSLVRIYNQGNYKDKINSANYWGWRNGLQGVEDRVESGLITQVETISAILGEVPIHFYISVDLDAVEELVNIVGGVWYEVPENVYNWQGRLLVEKGYQKLDGRKFMYFVRNRKGSSDYQRAGNQQNILKAAFSQFKKANKLVFTPQALLRMTNNVRTNLSLEQIMALALYATKEVDADHIFTHVLVGRYESGGIPGRRESLPYYLLNHPKRVELIERIWGKVVEAGPSDTLLPPLKKEDPVTEPGSGPSDEPADIGGSLSKP
ncbi:MAG: LCP family protein [Eubacteriales bacterium]|nr:LCP family protein [Eubacteriales bacterium]